MIDQNSRRQAATILKRFALGRITNYQCENEFLELPADDPVIYALSRTIMDISGDADKSYAEMFPRGSETRSRVCRWILFLKTEIEYKWPPERRFPGLRDLYRANWFEKLFRRDHAVARANERIFRHGDYNVWPFLREADLNAARLACAERQRSVA
jgi:hypothetical protein